MLEQFLKETQSHVKCGTRWLWWNDKTNEWNVNGRTFHQRANRCWYTGTDIEEALHELRKGSFGV